MFYKGDIAVLAKGVGMLIVRTLKTSWAFDPGEAVTTDVTRYHFVAIVFLSSMFDSRLNGCPTGSPVIRTGSFLVIKGRAHRHPIHTSTSCYKHHTPMHSSTVVA